MSRLGRGSPVPAVIVRNPAAPAGVTYDVTGGAASALVGSGVAAATYSPTGTGISALVGSGAASALFSLAGTGIAPLVGSGVAQATYAASGTGASVLVGSGSAVVEPFVPPAPPPSGGGGDAWAGTGERPYLPRQPKRREERKPKPVPHEPERARRIVKQAARAPQPLEFPPAPEILIPDLAYLEPIEPLLPDEMPDELPIAPDETSDTFPPEWAEVEELLLLGIL